MPPTVWQALQPRLSNVWRPDSSSESPERSSGGAGDGSGAGSGVGDEVWVAIGCGGVLGAWREVEVGAGSGPKAVVGITVAEGGVAGSGVAVAVGSGVGVGAGVDVARRNGDRTCGMSVPSGLVQASAAIRISKTASRSLACLETGNSLIAIFNGKMCRAAPGMPVVEGWVSISRC